MWSNTVNRNTFWIAGALAAFMVAAAPVDAQVRVGARVGANFANLSGDDADGFNSKTGLYVQGVVGFPMGDFFGIETGLAYTQKGAFEEHGDHEDEIDLTYLEIPVLFRANFSAEAFQPHLLVGPSVAFNIGCTSSEGNVETDCDDDDDTEIKGTDIGLIVGAGVDFPMGRMALTLDGFYNIGLTSIDDSVEDNDIRNEVWTIAAGISIPMGGYGR